MALVGALSWGCRCAKRRFLWYPATMCSPVGESTTVWPVRKHSQPCLSLLPSSCVCFRASSAALLRSQVFSGPLVSSKLALVSQHCCRGFAHTNGALHGGMAAGSILRVQQPLRLPQVRGILSAGAFHSTPGWWLCVFDFVIGVGEGGGQADLGAMPDGAGCCLHWLCR
jgi:hypothetical protein